MEPSSPQWLPELAGGQLQTELCELVEVGWKWGGEGRKEGRTQEAREIGWSFQWLLEIWAPQTWDGERVVFICFFLRKTFCFDCWGEAVIGKKKGPKR